MSGARLVLALIVFGCAVVVLIFAGSPTLFRSLFPMWSGSFDPAWFPLVFDGLVLLGFVTTVTSLFARYTLGLIVFNSLVIYTTTGVVIRWLSVTTTGQPFSWTPEQVLVASVTWPSFLVPYLLPQLWPGQ